MSADDAFSTMTADVLGSMAGVEQMIYRGDAGEQTVTGYLFQEHGYLGDDVPVSEDRWLCALQVSEVGSPQRGDRVTDRNGVEWTLQERVEADEWMEQWAVTKR